MIKNYIAECLDRISRNLALREHYTMAEYQRWFDQNPEYLHNGAVEQIKLIEPLTLEGTNDLYRANYWIERPNDKMVYGNREISQNL